MSQRYRPSSGNLQMLPALATAAVSGQQRSRPQSWTHPSHTVAVGCHQPQLVRHQESASMQQSQQRVLAAAFAPIEPPAPASPRSVTLAAARAQGLRLPVTDSLELQGEVLSQPPSPQQLQAVAYSSGAPADALRAPAGSADRRPYGRRACCSASLPSRGAVGAGPRRRSAAERSPRPSSKKSLGIRIPL
ncbi:hypothetical protein Efla_000149 [Eimeria flavescens]